MDERHFTEGDTQRANKPMKRCSASSASRKTHSKTTKCHLKQKPVTTPRAQKLDHIYTGGGMQNVQPFGENNLTVSLKKN